MKKMDQRAFRRKLLLKPINKWTLAPLIFGVASSLGAWTFGLDSPATLAAGLILSLISVGIYCNKLIFGWKENYEKLVDEWRQKIESDRDKALDDLYRELQKDGDERTESLLKDLRTLTKVLLAEQSDAITLSAMDLVSDVDSLFQRCVDYLRESLELWSTAQAMEREGIKQNLMQQRETIIQEVEKSLDNLGTVLSTLKKANIHSSDGNALADLRAELSSRMRIAEEVENRMAQIRQSVDYTANESAFLEEGEI